jgi:hypothetical protein
MQTNEDDKDEFHDAQENAQDAQKNDQDQQAKSKPKSAIKIRKNLAHPHPPPPQLPQPNKPVSISTADANFKTYKKFILEPQSQVDCDNYCESFKITDIMNIKKFVQNIKCYALNSPLDEDHYKYFNKTIVKEKGMYFLDRISLAQYNDYNTTEERNLIEIINGHHRIEGLRRVFSQVPDGDLPEYTICLRVDVYMLDKPDSWKTLNLFKKFNRVRPQKTNWPNKDLAVLIISKLNDTFDNDKFILIKDSDIRVHKPSIFKKEFSEKLERHLDHLLRTTAGDANSGFDFDMDIEEVIRKIIAKFKNYNDSLKDETLDWFNSKAQKDIVDGLVKPNAYKKAAKYGCFLGFIKLEHLISLCISL